MSQEPTTDSADDPLYGNRVSHLLGAAVPPSRPAMDSTQWQPPSCEELQALLHGYEVLQFVARGGMGAVYRGVQRSLGRQVAIKILPPALSDLDPHYAERFKQEARAMGQLNHPGIVAVHDFGEMEDGTLFFIMEFMEGTDVAQMVAKQGRLPSAHAMAITAHVCDALQYAHQCGVVHRDIKPANIMVGYDGRVKVADFGLAKQLRHTDASLTQSGFVMGTPHFVAPEALTLGLSVDHRADIYAVGVMLYQMLTGKVPQGVFEMPSLQVTGLDPRYDQIVAAAMREDRDRRYQQISEMRRALDAIMTQPVMKTEEGQEAAPEVATRTIAMKPVARLPHRSAPGNPQTPQQPKSNKLLPLGVVAVVLVLMGCLFFWPAQNQSPLKADSSGTSAVEVSTKSGERLQEMVIPNIPFAGASLDEALTFLANRSRSLDPEKKGVAVIASAEVRALPVKISFEVSNTKVKDFVRYLAMIARLDATWDGDSILWSRSATFRPPFKASSPSPRIERHTKLVFPSVDFVRANIDEAVTFLRLKCRDLDPKRELAHILVDPALDMTRKQITIRSKDIPLADALRQVAFVCDAEVICIGDAFYLQPRSLDSKPSAVVPSADASFEVKLDFVNNDNESKFDIGGFYGSGAALSPVKPNGVSRLPEGLKSPSFGEFKTGVGANETRHPFIIDEASTRTPRLFIDRNRNGDFTDDPAAAALNVTLDKGGEDFAIGGYPFIDMKFGRQTLEARLHVFYKKDKEGNVPHITYRSYYARMGSVRLGTRVIKAMLYDDRLSADFSHETCTFRLNLRDETSIGYRWEEMEAFPVKENFTIEGVTYHLSGVTPEGDSFQIAPTAGWLDQTVPAFSAKTLTDQIINVPVDIKGRALLIHFWSPSKFRSGAGHGFGVEDLPSLKAVYDKYQASGLVLLGVCVEGSTGKTKIPAFMDGNRVAWPQVCDGKGSEFDPLQKLFRDHSVPMNYLIDGDSGKVLATAIHGENMIQTVDKVMAERIRQ